MTQTLLQSYAIPTLQIAGALVLTQMLFTENAISRIVSEQLTEVIEQFQNAARNLFHDTPVVVLAGGITYFVNELELKSHPSLALSTQVGREGSLKAALFVSGVFALRAALSKYLRDINRENYKDGSQLNKLQRIVVLNFVPLAIGAAASYYASIPIKLTQSVLFTAALMPAIKLLGKGYEYASSIGMISRASNTIYAWLK